MEFEMNGTTLVRYNGTAERVAIPQEVEIIGPKAFLYHPELREIAIPDTVWMIGTMAFAHCTGLQSVTLPSSIMYIDDHAFAWCTALKEVFLLENPLIVERNVFYATPWMDEQTGCILLGTHMLGYRGRDPVLRIPEGVTSLVSEMYIECAGGGSGLREVIFSDSVLVVGDDVFCNEYSLQRVVFKSHLGKIGARCFCNCPSLTQVENIDETVPLGKDCFYDSPLYLPPEKQPNYLRDPVSGEEKGAPKGHPFYSAEHHLATTRQAETCILAGRFEELTTLNPEDERILKSCNPAGVTCFKFHTFPLGPTVLCEIMKHFRYVDRIIIPPELLKEGYFTMGGVLYQREENGVKLLLAPPKMPRTFRIPYGVTSIESCAFTACDFQTVLIPESVEKIQYSAFFECNKLEKAVIPATVREIGDLDTGDIFHGCSALKAIEIDPYNPFFFTLDGCLYKWSGELLCCPAGKEGRFELPVFCHDIQSLAFVSCKKLTEIVLHSDYITAWGCAFWGCSGLSSFHVPAKTEFPGYHPFAECTNLKDLYFESATYSPCEESFDEFWNGPKTLTVHAPAGSKAEEYAKRFGYNFKAI